MGKINGKGKGERKIQVEEAWGGEGAENMEGAGENRAKRVERSGRRTTIHENEDFLL